MNKNISRKMVFNTFLLIAGAVILVFLWKSRYNGMAVVEPRDVANISTGSAVTASRASISIGKEVLPRKIRGSKCKLGSFTIEYKGKIKCSIRRLGSNQIVIKSKDSSCTLVYFRKSDDLDNWQMIRDKNLKRFDKHHNPYWYAEDENSRMYFIANNQGYLTIIRHGKYSSNIKQGLQIYK